MEHRPGHAKYSVVDMVTTALVPFTDDWAPNVQRDLWMVLRVTNIIVHKTGHDRQTDWALGSGHVFL